MEELKLQEVQCCNKDTSATDIPLPTNSHDLIPKGEDISPRSMMASGGEGKEPGASNGLMQAIDILGAVKVRDGLFLGDEFASQVSIGFTIDLTDYKDLEFVIANKVTHIINCAGRQIFNQWTPVGVKYLTFYWLDDDRQLIFDDHDQVAKEIFDFVEEANQESSGVLVHSVRGQSRACCVLSIYLMIKFKWTLLKSLEFINSRRPNLEIRASFLQQLSAWERRTRDKFPKRTDRWDELHDENSPEELLLRNTFVNAQMQPVNFLQQWKEDVMNSITQSARALRTKIKWADNGDDAMKKELVRENSDHDLINKDESQIVKVDTHKQLFSGKSALKVLQQPVATKPPEILEQKDEEITHIQQKPNQIEKTTEKPHATTTPNDKDKPKPKIKKRPSTPVLENKKDSNPVDLISQSPRSLTQTDEPLDKPVKQPKRANSSKKFDKNREEKEKRDQFKARVAWNASSPKDKKSLISNFIDHPNSDSLNGSKQQKLQQSPVKSIASSILKKELLEKAKKALAENAKVNVGLDIKKIQETLNKIQIVNPKPITQAQQQFNKPSTSTGNIINNNNINNFFIQNASVIELPTKETKITAPIGQHHHKRANSGTSSQFAQQLKQNLIAQPLQIQGHRKNQLSDGVPFIMSTNATEMFRYQGLQRPQSQSQAGSKKDFKQMIRELQKESISAMQSQQQLWMQKHKTPSVIGVVYPYDNRRQQNTESRPSSASQKQLLSQQRVGSANRNRKLKKPKANFIQQRRAQTPMPQSPSSNNMLFIQSQQQQQKQNSSLGNSMLIQTNPNIIMNKHPQPQSQTSSHQNLQQIPHKIVRSKSPALSQYQQKLQAKTAYMLMNNANIFVNKKIKTSHSGYQSPKKLQ